MYLPPDGRPAEARPPAGYNHKQDRRHGSKSQPGHLRAETGPKFKGGVKPRKYQ
jgi:hypothetical protein